MSSPRSRTAPTSSTTARTVPGFFFLFALLLGGQLLQAQTTWDGSDSNDWSNAANWSAGVPDAADDVTIPNVTLPNVAPVIMGGTAALAKSVHVQTSATLTINATGSLTINGSSAHSGFTAGLYNQGTVENSGNIILGSTASVGNYGLWNLATFNNNSGGEISIDRSGFVGLYNNSGTFTNAAKITIGAVASVGQTGLWNLGTFNNNSGGEITIDRSNTTGLNNGSGTFTNAAKITIGAVASIGVGSEGILNSATFNNNSGGEITIDRSTFVGLYNTSGTFTNAAKITIGAVASVGSNGVFNTATFNNSTCTALVRIVSNSIINNTSTFTNAGLITENASGNSSITSNAGIVQNLNGGTFTVGSGNPAITSTATITDACCPNPPIAAIAITENNVSASPFTGLAYHNISYTDGILCTGPNYPNPTTSATLTASGGGTYLWSTNATSAAITTSTAGTYTVTVTSPIGCTSTASQTISVNAAPSAGTITATPNLPGINGSKGVCFGSTITLSSTVPGGEWSMFTGFQVVSVNSVTGLVTPIVNTNSTDTSSVRYQVSALGCVSGVLTQVEVLNSPSAGTISGNPNICGFFGNATQLTINNGASGGTWASSNTNVATVNSSGFVQAAPTTTNTGTSIISYTVTNGTCTNTATILITVNPNPSALVTSTPYNTCINTDVTISVPDAGTGATYAWSGDITTSGNPVISNSSTSGFKVYSVTVTAANGCSSTGFGSHIVNQPINTTITATPNPLCFGVTLSLSIPQAASTTVSWSGPGINSITGFSTTASPTTTGLKTYMVTATTDAYLGNCVATGMVDVNVIDCCPAPGTIWYVNAAAAPGGNGASWDCAFQDLQSALAAASSGHQIWVAEGTYKPTSGSDRTISFLMKNGVEVLGGFPNTGDPGLGDRDWIAHVTTLSGDIGAPGLSDNSYHVVFFDHAPNSTLLDGFTITGGNGETSQNGGGIYNDGSGVGRQSNPRIAHCTITGNVARSGGGLFNDGYRGNSSPEVTDCFFSGNKATRDGGAVYNFGGNNGNSSPVFTNVVFLGNKAERIGGGVFNDAVDAIGGVSNPEFVNCSFSGNQADFGVGGMYNDAYTGTCSPAITNCILWGNAGQIDNRNATPTVAYSIVQGGHAGTGNLDNNPLFVSQPPVGLGTSGDLHLQICSPAIDAGNDADAPAADLDQNARFEALAGGSISDMGAFEFQSAATPTIAICQTSVTAILDNTGHATVLATALNNGSTGCSPLVFSIDGQSSASFNCSQIGAQSVTLTATYVNRASTCITTVNVMDNAPPAITCPANIAKTTDPGQCSAVTMYSVTAADNCSSQFTLTRTNGLPSGVAFPTGTNVVNWKVTDAGGNSTICSFTVTVTDGQNPSIVCPGNISKTTDPGQCSAVTTYATPTFSDNCAGAYLTRTSGQASGTAFPTGTHTVNWKATDLAGNSSVCNFTVTVTDGQAPAITCPANLVKNTGAGQCTAVVTYTNPTFSDNCTGATAMLFSGQASGTAFPKGTNSVVWQTTDGAGLTKRCTFTVTVNDAQAPTIACPSNQTKAADAGICTAVVNYTTPTFTDNCAGGGVAIQSGLASDQPFPKGITTVVWKATDAVGLTKTCSFKVTVNDTQAPTFTLCPSSQSVSTDAGQCTAAVNYATPTAADNCTPPPTVVKQSGLASGLNFPKGASVVVWKATDGAGLTKTCSFTVTVTDAQLPTITCPSNIAVMGSGPSCSAVVAYANPTATDNCAITSNYLLSGLASGAQFSQGVTTNIWKATDNSGLTQTCAFTVTVSCGTGSEQLAVSREELAGSNGQLAVSSGHQMLAMNLAPNPATTQVQVIVEGLGENGGEITVLDAQGRVVWQQSNVQHPTSSIDVSTLPSGLYQVRLCTERGVVAKGLVVSRL